MESDSDLQSSFSTLNVNAVEFVPNFGPPSVGSTTADESETTSDDSAKPVIETPENNGNGKSYAKLQSDVSSKEKKILPHRKL